MALTASSLPAQRRTVGERLGYPAEWNPPTPHAHDLGLPHSVNAASFDALDRGAVSSASVMMPTPWVTEVAAYAKTHPDADIGIHVTLTSEWKTYRWGSVDSRDRVPSLLDAAGIFPSETGPVAANANPVEV